MPPSYNPVEHHFGTTRPPKHYIRSTQLNHHPPDPLPLHLRPVKLSEKTNIPQIPLRQHDHDRVKPPRPVVVVAILAPRARDEGIIAVRLREPQRLRHVRHGAGSEQEFQKARSAAQDGGLDGVGVGARLRGRTGGVYVCAVLDQESGHGFAARGEGDHEGRAAGGGAGVDFGAVGEEDLGDGFAALGDGFLEDVQADGGGDLVFGVQGGAVAG